MQNHKHIQTNQSPPSTRMSRWVIMAIIVLLVLSACTPARDKDGSWTENGASQTISTYFRALYPDLNPKVRFPVEEITPLEVWDAMGVQIFRVSDDIYANETFLFNEEIMLQMGTAFGGTGVNSMLVSELYREGQPALLFTFNFGSGVSQTHIAAYVPDYDASRFLECEQLYQGELQLVRTGVGGVDVQIIDRDSAGSAQTTPPMLGSLAIVKDSSQLFLDLTVNPSLPARYRELIKVFK